jgi:hypothetical protein
LATLKFIGFLVTKQWGGNLGLVKGDDAISFRLNAV